MATEAQRINYEAALDPELLAPMLVELETEISDVLKENVSFLRSLADSYRPSPGVAEDVPIKFLTNGYGFEVFRETDGHVGKSRRTVRIMRHNPNGKKYRYHPLARGVVNIGTFDSLYVSIPENTTVTPTKDNTSIQVNSKLEATNSFNSQQAVNIARDIISSLKPSS